MKKTNNVTSHIFSSSSSIDEAALNMISHARPEASLVKLILWVHNQIIRVVDDDADDYNSYIHNKISVDKNFVEFCEDKKYKIECIYRDPVASWDDDGVENYNAQGVFKIIAKKFHFYHAALFHKGNQNEDEVSFFVFVKDSDYEKYAKLREEYIEWSKQKSRETNEIFVIGGDPIPFSRDLTWDDVYLEESLKQEIRLCVEGFLKTKHICEKQKISWKQGVIFHGDPGNGKTMTMNVLISQYNFKPVTIRGAVGNDTDELIEEAFAYAEEHGPSLLFLEDLPGLLQNISLSHFLQLLDGVRTREGLFIIATANDLTHVDSALSNRPSRFDRKIEFPIPNLELSFKYLKKWFVNISDDFIKSIAEKTLKAKFSFAYLKELFTLSVYHAIARNEEEPNEADISKALASLIKDKRSADKGYVGANTKKFNLVERFDNE